MRLNRSLPKTTYQSWVDKTHGTLTDGKTFLVDTIKYRGKDRRRRRGPTNQPWTSRVEDEDAITNLKIQLDRTCVIEDDKAVSPPRNLGIHALYDCRYRH